MDERARNERIERRLADGVFSVLLATAVVLAGWLGARHDHYWDWTDGRHNSLRQESAVVLDRLAAGQSAPLQITVFVDRHHPLAKTIDRLLARYRGTGAELAVGFIDPQLFPEQARAAQVSLFGQMLLEYRGRRETVSELSEAALTAAIARLDRERDPWILVLEGHGERRIDGEKAQDLGRFAHLLRGQGFRLQPLDLTVRPAVPENAELLLLSAPAIALFPGEAQALIDYLARGGNLLWLMDPGEPGGLESVAAYLGVEPLPGILVDANVAALNIPDPTVAMVARHPEDTSNTGMHPGPNPVGGLTEHSLFPGSIAFAERVATGWTLTTPLMTQKHSWNETGPVRGEVSREQDLGELPGPLPLALALTRPSPGQESPGHEASSAPRIAPEQRVLVMGDGDFLSNAHLDTAGNRALALRLVQWLTEPEGAANVPVRSYPDRELMLDHTQILVIGGGSLLVLPALFLVTGLLIRRHRRRG